MCQGINAKSGATLITQTSQKLLLTVQLPQVSNEPHRTFALLFILDFVAHLAFSMYYSKP